MNILKYLIAENINDKEESIDSQVEQDVNHDSIADNVFSAFSALTASAVNVSNKDKTEQALSLANSGIVFNDSHFAVDGLNVHLDTVH